MNQATHTRADASVAIIGVGCRFPGGASDPDSFWRLLDAGRNAVTEIPPDRIEVQHYFDPTPATAGRMMTRWGGFLDRIDEFDADFFGISPREAERMDPQQRLLLETAWEALEDAGQDLRGIVGTGSGVFIGQWTSDFESRLFADPEAVDFLMTTGSGRYAASGRLSYLLGFRGPSVTIDTACSSSLAAVHLAVRSVRAGESRIALAGGVNVILQPHITVAYSQSRMMAPDGKCKFGDAAGDGYVRSEGAGLVVLKSLRNAIADKDRIYAVIRGSAINNDGQSSGVMGRPSRVGHEELIRAALEDAGVSPGEVSYLEAHGTGTRAGDPVELAALSKVLAEGRSAESRVYIGSVKTNIGHTEAAAGVAGLIKAALVLHHGFVPPSLHFEEPNPAVPWSSIPLEIVRSTRPLPEQTCPRCAGVNAFGISGSNAHVVLEEAVRTVSATAAFPENGRELSLLGLSAKHPGALRALAGRYADLLTADAAPALGDVCWSAGTRRTSLAHRGVFVAADHLAMADVLRRYAAGESPAAEGIVHLDTRPKIAFVLPGQGAQWVGMGRELLAREPVFRAALEQCDKAARPFIDWSIIEQLEAAPETDAFLMNRIDVIQPVLVALAIAYASLLRSLGIQPDAVVGHSMGEVGAAHIAGVLDLDQAMHVICRRSALMRRVSGQGAMALVDLSTEEAHKRLTGFEDRVSIAASNDPRSTVISGLPETVQQIMVSLEKEDVFCRLVKVDVASHSPQMEPLATELAGELAGMEPRSGDVPIYSTLLGRRADGHEFDAKYWQRNMREPVLFSKAVSQLVEDGVTIFVELGPHPILLPSVQKTASATTTIAFGRREEPEQAAVLTAIGSLWCAGYPIDWYRVMPEGGRFVPLPLYPWQRERYWGDAAELRPAGSQLRKSRRTVSEDSRRWLYHLAWKPLEPLQTAARSATGDARWLVVTDDHAMGAAVVVAIRSGGSSADIMPFKGLDALPSTREPGGVAPQGIVVLADDGPDTAYLPLRVLQFCLASDWQVRPRLWFVTCGAQSVLNECKERVSVDQAALWGAARVIAEEHPELWGGLVELDPAGAASAKAACLAHQVLSCDTEDQVAFRSNRRHVLRLVSGEGHSATTGLTWRADAAYLITGGLGAIGLQIAHAMVEDGARRLILMGRTPLPPREQWRTASPNSAAGARITAVRALEAMGAAVHTPAVDVGNEMELRAFLDRYSAEGWPPIRGVIHAAGSLDNCLAGSMSRQTFDKVTNSKLRGAKLLERLLSDLDFFVLISSIAGIVPQPGVANYAAANSGLDALAKDRCARGLPALSIAWGPWGNTGLARGEVGEHGVFEMARQGIGTIPVEDGAALFAWLCGRSTATIAVMPADWSRFRQARSGRPMALARDQLDDMPETALDRSELLTQLEAVDPSRRRQLLEKEVRNAIGHVLKIAPARLDPRKTFGGMGLSSLMAVELRNRLESALRRPLSATLAWNYPTIEALVAYLAGNGSASPPSPGAPHPMEGELTASLSQVAALSDEDAMRVLLGRSAGGI